MQKIFSTIKSTRPYLDYCIFGLILATAPWFVENTQWFLFAWITTISTFIVYAIACLGKNILMGYGGLASLGTAGFIGVGAYMSAILTIDLGWSFFPVFITTVLFTMLLGVIVGLLASRVEGFFLAIATLVIAEIFRTIFTQWEIFNGFRGRQVPRFPHLLGEGANESIAPGGLLYDSFLHGTLTRNQTYFLLIIFLVLAMMLTYRIFKSSTGRALSAMSGSQSAATAMGVNIFRYRILAFTIATGFAGASGALFMAFFTITMPDQWGLIISLFIFGAGVIGGLRSVAGTILGAAIVWLVPQLILVNLPVIGDINGMPFLFKGLMIIVVVLFSPAGLIYIFWKYWYKFTGLFRRKGGEA